jgi:hypothetical protein
MNWSDIGLDIAAVIGFVVVVGIPAAWIADTIYQRLRPKKGYTLSHNPWLDR